MGLIIEQGQTFLGALKSNERQDLLAQGHACSYAPGELLLREGENGDFVLAITDGWSIVSSQSERGVRLILALRGSGDLVGDLAVLDRNPRSATVAALGSVKAVRISGDRFRAFIAARPRVTALVMAHLGARLRAADGERKTLATSTVLERLAARIGELVEHAGMSTTEGIVVDLALPQHDLAATVGATREAVAKALRTLRNRGVVRTGPHRLLVVQPELLRLISAGRDPGAS